MNFDWVVDGLLLLPIGVGCVAAIGYIIGRSVRTPYECEPEEIIVHEWQGSWSGETYKDIYIPMYQDYFGRFYYGKFDESMVTGKLRQHHFIGGDDYIRYDKLKKQIDRTGWVGRSIDREKANVDRAKAIYEEATR